MGKKKCDTCDKPIPSERLEALPETTTCVKHSREAGYIGVNIFAHKTAPELGMVKGDREESVRQLWRAYNRGR
jgi:hypothetical protein